MSQMSEARERAEAAQSHSPVAQMSGVLDDHFAVKIVNRDDRRWKFGYANRDYHLAPAGSEGDSAIVPYHAAVLWFGDPRSINKNTGKREHQYRDAEMQRLSVRYGLLDDAFWTEFADEVRMTSVIIVDSNRTLEPRPYNGRHHPNLPDVAVIDLRDNSEILTVIDDPSGTNMVPPTNTETEHAILAEQVRAQAEQLNNLQLLLAQRDPQAAEDLAAAGVVPSVPASTPTTDDIAATLAADELTSDPTPGPDDVATRDTGQRAPRSAKPKS